MYIRLVLWIVLAMALASPSLAIADEAVNGERLADACSSCHGLGGHGGGAIPAIAGRDPEDFVAQMLAFREQKAPATIMNRLARGYTDEEIAALADYFSGLETP